MSEHFDVVVVGAGPAGSAAGLVLARAGVDVLVLEKSKVPGQRSMTGGVLFGQYLPGYGMVDLLPDFEKEAPLERQITQHTAYVISDPVHSGQGASYRIREITENSFATRLGLTGLDCVTGHDYSVLRAPLDRWFAAEVRAVGGMVATEQSVEDFLWEGERIVGVRTQAEDIRADVVIDAGGVTSTLVEKAGLRPRLSSKEVYHGVKHVYRLDPKAIEERFQTEEQRGRALFFFGEFMHGVSGGAFLYPNRDTMSVGIVVSLDSVVAKCSSDPGQVGKPLDLLEEFERHPVMWQYLEGATLVEYSAHNIPKGPQSFLRRPYRSGFLVIGDALGAFIKIGGLIDGMRRAVASGIMAAQTYLQARRRGDFSEGSLSYYEELLRPIESDIRRSKRNNSLTESALTYRVLPKLLFAFGLGARVDARGPARTADQRDAIQRIQERTGLLEYEEDKDYAHIRVDYAVCATSSTKAWVPACPFNCYTLVTPKGVFASYRDLFEYNLRSTPEGKSHQIARRATRSDIQGGQVRFDHVACVGCGTCGVLGPPAAVLFGHERDGHGVKYRFG
jgi:electron transfer flavoprotein-quinone oxidoreductase